MNDLGPSMLDPILPVLDPNPTWSVLWKAQRTDVVLVVEDAVAGSEHCRGTGETKR